MNFQPANYQPANAVAFKEWAAICQALGSGQQSLILRKGGIHEGEQGFRVAHPEFWLYPTYLHEGADQLVSGAAPLLAVANASRPEAGTICFSYYAQVAEVYEICDEAHALGLAGLHFWSEATVRQRFHYRQPGFFALVVRVWALSKPVVIEELPRFAGCRSWVELSEPLSTAGLVAVLSDKEFESRRQQIADQRGGSGATCAPG
jgi:hypothetical protein